ncbi:MAG: ABC transporter permease, partial [Polaromonas sp.]|nr:ABC transporter permease [Polaromonas sp.]
LSRAALVTALESIKDYNMGGFSVAYGPNNHEGSNFTELTIMGRGGKFVH